MTNPWLALPTTAPYVLPAEHNKIERFNHAYPEPDYRIRLNVLPEPYIGNPQAKVVILSLNPGYDETDPDWHARPDFRSSLVANLRHEPEAYPFYPLNPAYSGSGIHKWWRSKLNDLIRDTSLSTIAHNVLCVEWFPYHSIKYKAMPKGISGGLLPSQAYAISLVTAAVDRGATLIAMRRYQDWAQQVPGLRAYDKVHHLRSPQSGHLSSNNLINYPGIVKALS